MTESTYQSMSPTLHYRRIQGYMDTICIFIAIHMQFSITSPSISDSTLEPYVHDLGDIFW